MLSRFAFPILIIAICLLAAGQVWLSHERVGMAQNMAHAKQENTIVQQDVQSLKLELASLMRPDTLRRLAREKLGMHSPTPMQVVQP